LEWWLNPLLLLAQINGLWYIKVSMLERGKAGGEEQEDKIPDYERVSVEGNRLKFEADILRESQEFEAEVNRWLQTAPRLEQIQSLEEVQRLEREIVEFYEEGYKKIADLCAHTQSYTLPIDRNTAKQQLWPVRDSLARLYVDYHSPVLVTWVDTYHRNQYLEQGGDANDAAALQNAIDMGYNKTLKSLSDRRNELKDNCNELLTEEEIEQSLGRTTAPGDPNSPATVFDVQVRAAKQAEIAKQKEAARQEKIRLWKIRAILTAAGVTALCLVAASMSWLFSQFDTKSGGFKPTINPNPNPVISRYVPPATTIPAPSSSRGQISSQITTAGPSRTPKPVTEAVPVSSVPGTNSPTSSPVPETSKIVIVTPNTPKPPKNTIPPPPSETPVPLVPPTKTTVAPKPSTERPTQRPTATPTEPPTSRPLPTFTSRPTVTKIPSPVPLPTVTSRPPTVPRLTVTPGIYPTIPGGR
jgi:hypothetical protein